MTNYLRFLTVLWCLLAGGFCLNSKGQGSFGNGPVGGDGFHWSVYNGSTISGGAVSFTPTQDINVSSVTLWLTGFSGAYGTKVNAGIYLNQNDPAGFLNGGSARSYPGAAYLTFTTPEHNDGSLAAFTYLNPVANPFNNPSGSMVLSANITYWLLVTPSGPMAGQPYFFGGDWVGGGTPAGDAVYNGAVSADWYNGKYDSSTVMPAFAINSVFSPNTQISPVPEPKTVALLGMFAVCLLLRKVWRQPKLARRRIK